MSLPTDLEIKSYLRISTDVEDILIFTLNQTAQAVVTQYLGVPLVSEARTFVGRFPRMGLRRELSTQLVIPVIPCDTTATITDDNEDTVDPATYTIDGRTGLVDCVRLESFSTPPYDIAVNVGWSYHPNYDADVDPVLRQAVLDLAGDMWKRRIASMQYEQSGGQVSTTYLPDDIPPRTKMLLESLRPKARAW